MDEAEWMHYQHPITNFCLESDLVKVKNLCSIDEVKEQYQKYIDWCKRRGYKKPKTFNQFIYHLHQLHLIVSGGLFLKYWEKTGLPQSKFVT